MFFDDTNLYVGKRSVVPLNKIQSLKMNSKRMNKRYQIELQYIDEKDELSFIRFFPRIVYMHLNEFCLAVSKRNPKAQLQKLFVGPFQIDKFKD